MRNPEAESLIFTSFFRQLKPKPKMTVSDFADANICLPPESSAKPGKFYTDTVPYLRGFQDAATEAGMHVMVAMWGSQTSKSTGLNNIHMYFAKYDPCPQMMIQPTEKTAQDYSRSRLEPLIRDSQSLAELFDIERRKNTVLEKYYPGGRFVLVGSNSPAGVSSKPIRVVSADEIDRFEVTKEGNVIELGKKRQTTFWNWLLILTSTPGVKGDSDVEYWWELSDKRKFFVPCPECGHKQVMYWSKDTVVWNTDEDGKHHPETARYVCEACGAHWNDIQINEAVQKGEWIATAEFNGIAGFGMLPEWYAPWKKISETVKDFLACKDDPDKFRVWWNTALGLPWAEDREALEVADLYEIRQHYDPVVPEEAGVVTCVVDTQDDRLEVYTKAWGRGEESWALEHRVFWGDTSIMPDSFSNPGQQHLFDQQDTEINPWYQLDQFIQIPYHHRSGVLIPISIVCIDTGGHRTDQVYQYVKMRERRLNVRGIKGDTNPFKQLISPPSKSKRSRAGRDYKINLYMLGTQAAKDTVSARLRHTLRKDPDERYGPAVYHYPDFPYEFFQQLTVEKKMRKKVGGRIIKMWVNPKNERNEAWDLEVYSLAALRMRCPNAKSLNERCDYYGAVGRAVKEKIPVENLLPGNRRVKKRKVRSAGVK